jgi:hypothetical protein
MLLIQRRAFNAPPVRNGFIPSAKEAGYVNCINLHEHICATRQTKKMRLTGRRIFTTT